MTRDGEGQDEQRSRSALVRLLVWFIVLFLGVVLGVAVAQWRQWDFDYGRFQTLGRGQLEDERLRQEILKLQRERSLWRNLATNATILIGALGFVVTGFKYIDERQRQRIEDTRQQEADRDQREKDRLTERHRLAALYVNPFLFACEDLQSRLYNILCGGGLGVLRQQYRNGRHAVELIYLNARYFAYEELLIRYSPYGVDGEVLGRIRGIRNAFSTSNFGHDEWRIFRPQQNALGRYVRAGRKGEYGDEPDSISLWEFEASFGDLAKQDERLRQARDSLAKLKNVTEMKTETYRRLARVQGHLIDLLKYLEAQESAARGASFSLFDGTRKRAPENKPVSGSC
jgi:hypothetical protein